MSICNQHGAWDQRRITRCTLALLDQYPGDWHGTTQQLKSALWFSIGKMVDEESLKLHVNATPQFIGALTEMVWTQIGRMTLFLTHCTSQGLTFIPENVAVDLESFSKHAGRTTVTTEDVLLLTRRNEDLNKLIKDFITSREKTQQKSRHGWFSDQGNARLSMTLSRYFRTIFWVQRAILSKYSRILQQARKGLRVIEERLGEWQVFGHMPLCTNDLYQFILLRKRIGRMDESAWHVKATLRLLAVKSL